MKKPILIYLALYLVPHIVFCQNKNSTVPSNSGIYFPVEMKPDGLEQKLKFGSQEAVISTVTSNGLRTYALKTNASLRDNIPSNKCIEFSESKNHAFIRTGSIMFDGLYTMATDEAMQNSVSEIQNTNYTNGNHHLVDVFQTGEKWTYVWTRDLAYAVNLALAGYDPKRSVNSLLFKTSELKDSVNKKGGGQIIQDTGSGGSYPVSTDRVVWALGAWETLKFLKDDERVSFLNKIYPILINTIEQDRQLVYDRLDGLYRGEQSFLDWREQTYPLWTKKEVLPIALSKTLSVNVLNYCLMKITADCAELKLQGHVAAKYRAWAEALKEAINLHFYDKESGLYSTYLISDGINNIRIKRYDLLSNALAVIFEIADQERAKSVLTNYPVGLHGPSVVWPQESSVPIYHNQAIWPFVTAYWIKAACKLKKASAVNHGMLTMHRLAALNLSNMENYDFVSGQAQVKGQAMNGPSVNSRRQLWSVAGYMSMVQSVLFGMQTSMDGLRFSTYLTAELRNELFASTDTLSMLNIDYRGKQNNVKIHLPTIKKDTKGTYEIKKILFNGQNVGSEYISSDRMQASNQWDIYLQVDKPKNKQTESLKIVDVQNTRLLYTPAMPEWNAAKNGGITVEEGSLKLHFSHPNVANVTFNIYRDGKCVASNIMQTTWLDQSAKNYSAVAYGYAIEAVDKVSGTVSHLSPIIRYFNSEKTYIIPAVALKNQGGTLVDGHHFTDWGKPSNELRAQFTVNDNGRYVICSEFANGAGPINTGIACAVKRLAIRELVSDTVIATDYLIMPQSANWKRWDISSPVIANLKAGKKYELLIFEDEYALNMSYFEVNKWYKKSAGGALSYNMVDIASVQIKLLAEEKKVK